ncbi:MAG: glycoside hydrolase family 65 protein, partial [Muribaculaceae bacterium]|nr:glycoside hydrolase family 65 protein [Muribaculaceae bacterium]
YKDRIDMTHGPAMTFGIFTVSYARLGNREKAEQMFRRSYRPNMRPPFGVLAETPTSQNPYFATGGGALLQAVINGFGGLELTDQGIIQLPSVLPASWKKLTIKGVGPDQREWVIEN